MPPPPAAPAILDAYYLDSHMATCVPRSIRRDLRWMADRGTNTVSVTILEEHLRSGTANVDIICEEARRAGMRVFATVSRWGGLVAGAPKVPSTFAVEHPELWALQRDGAPHGSGGTGPIVSVHHPQVLEFFRDGVERLLRRWPIEGITWDEPKSLHLQDWSPAARSRRPPGAGGRWDTDAVADFFAAVSAHAKRIRPHLVVSMFVYSDLALTHPYVVQRAAAIPSLDYYGCDGRPWSMADHVGPGADPRRPFTKVLLPTAAEFVRAAHGNGKGAMVLIENFAYGADERRCLETMRRTLPEVLALRPEHLTYYYCGRDVADPEANMRVLAEVLRRCTTREALATGGHAAAWDHPTGHPGTPEVAPAPPPGGAAITATSWSRRDFLHHGAVAGALTTLVAGGCRPRPRRALPLGTRPPAAPGILNAYYVRAHMYTCVPRNLRDDFLWMVDHGTGAVTIAVLEQDLQASVRNLDIICAEAQRSGLRILVLPTRWARIVGGAPDVPSPFTVEHPRSRLLAGDGRPFDDGVGPIGSVHDPGVGELFRSMLHTLLTRWPVEGIVVEPTTLTIADHSPAAQSARPPGGGRRWDTDRAVTFFDGICAWARSIRSDLVCAVLAPAAYAVTEPYVAERIATMSGATHVGCTGRPWREPRDPAGGGANVLLPNARAFLDLASRHGRPGAVTMETHDLVRDTPHRRMTLAQGVREVLGLGADLVSYDYFGQNVAAPEETMAAIGRALCSG